MSTSSGAGTPANGDIQRAIVQYPGGLAARFRWAGSAAGAAVFGVSETGGRLVDLTGAVGAGARACHAELRIEGPAGTWTARLASDIYDVPEGALWDEAQLLLVKYGFTLYAFNSRSGELSWQQRSGTPIVALLTSARLNHVVLQSEVETIALRQDGSVAWHVRHQDVIAEAQLVGARLDLVTFAGEHILLDPRTGLGA